MPPPLSEDEYASSEDSDFAPEPADAPISPTSDSESETEAAAAQPAAERKAQPATKRKRGANDNDEEAEDAGFENSGDEAIIKKGRKRRKKQDAVREDEDEGGEGGLIKTRRQRAAEKAERKAQVVKGPVTIDVDAVWAEMLAGSSTTTTQLEKKKNNEEDDQEEGSKEDTQQIVEKPTTEAAVTREDEDMILIKRKYNFAGKIHTETKLVPRTSAEAQLYLSSIDSSLAAPTSIPPTEEEEEPPRQIRRAYRSKFEPTIFLNPTSNTRQDLNLLLASTLQSRSDRSKEKAKKLNTVEKSRMDWAGYVDQEGLKDELELAGRSKGSFAERQRFLAQSDGRRDEEARRARVAGKV